MEIPIKHFSLCNKSLSLFDRSGEIPSAQPTLFEYFFDSKKLVWVPWVDIIPEYLHDPEKKFSEILVPTVDTVRTTWLLELMVSIKRPVVLVGETGTSKSATTANFLRSLDKDSTVSYCPANKPEKYGTFSFRNEWTCIATMW